MTQVFLYTEMTDGAETRGSLTAHQAVEDALQIIALIQGRDDGQTLTGYAILRGSIERQDGALGLC